MSNDYTRKTRKKRRNYLPLIGLMVVAYAVLQVYLVQNSRVEIVKALEGYINDSVISTGIVCREEMVLTNTFDGVLSYQLEEGERVSKCSLVAKIYPSYNDIELLKDIEFLQELINGLNSVENYGAGTSGDISFTKKSLNENILQLSKVTSNGNYEDVKQIVSQISTDINKVSMATGKLNDLSQQKTYLAESMSSLKSNLSQSTGSLYAPITGYFLKKSDGYESIATVDNFLNYSYEEGQKILSTSVEHIPATGEYGKLISDYKWNLCFYVDNEQAKKFTVNKTVDVNLFIEQDAFQKGTITHIQEKGEKTLIVVQCTLMDENASISRVEECEIRFKKYRHIIDWSE